MAHARWLAISLLLGLGGCPATSETTDCSTCAAGWTCDPNLGCVPPAAVDAAVAQPDLTAPPRCSPGCVGATPVCAPGNRCVTCLVDGDCQRGQACCGERCLDVQTDPGNCGACGTACNPANAAGQCAAGKCALGACRSGWANCDADATNGCEVALRVDPNNCTACGMACSVPHAITGCADGCYVRACQFGFDDCNNDLKDGCEVSVLSDANNCGACGSKCTGAPNAMVACQNALCTVTGCNQDFADCDKDPKNGCESSLMRDPKNCGACGVVCNGMNMGCNMGKCGMVIAGCSNTAKFTLEVVPGVWACATDHVIGTYAESNALCNNGSTPATYKLVHGLLPYPTQQDHNKFVDWYNQSMPQNGGYIRTGQKRRGGCQPEAHGDVYIGANYGSWGDMGGGWYDLYNGGSSCNNQTTAANNMSHMLAGVICVQGVYELPMP